jgi:chromosome segregation ATPase
MTESGKFRGVRPESGIETPEYRHSGVDFDYFFGELNQLNTQIERIRVAVSMIREPDIRKDPEIIASFWEKMAPEIQKKEEERKKLLGKIGIFQAIILEFDKPEKGMPKALEYIEQNLEGKRDPDEIADEIKAIAAARDEIDNNMGALHDNVRDAETHILHVQAQIKEVGKAMDKNARLQEIKIRPV